MSALLRHQRLTAELATLEGMLERISSNDIVGRIGIESRLNDVRKELGEIQNEPRTKAGVALVFEGDPVLGSSSIKASFGSRAIESFQRAVSTTYNILHEGGVGERGPISSLDNSALYITGVVHGSFGFVLEEFDPRGDPLIDSALKMATDAVVQTIERVASENVQDAEAALEEINERLFVNVRDLVKLVHESGATVKIAADDRVIDLGAKALKRAYERLADASIRDDELVLRGVLEGILPSARRFEFRSDDLLIRGRVAKDISEEYLESIKTAPLVGRTISGVFRKRSVLDGSSTLRESYTLVRIVPDVGPASHGLLPRPT